MFLCLYSLRIPASEGFQAARARADTHCHRETMLPLTDGQPHPHELPLQSPSIVTIGLCIYHGPNVPTVIKILMREKLTASHHQRRAVLTAFHQGKSVFGSLEQPSVVIHWLSLSWDGSKVGFSLEGLTTIYTGRWREIQVPEPAMHSQTCRSRCHVFCPLCLSSPSRQGQVSALNNITMSLSVPFSLSFSPSRLLLCMRECRSTCVSTM